MMFKSIRWAIGLDGHGWECWPGSNDMGDFLPTCLGKGCDHLSNGMFSIFHCNGSVLPSLVICHQTDTERGIINYGKWSKSKVKHYVDNIKCAKLMTWMSTSRTVAPVPVPRLNMWTPSLPLPKMWSTAWNKIVITSYAMMLKFAMTMMPIMINDHQRTLTCPSAKSITWT